MWLLMILILGLTACAQAAPELPDAGEPDDVPEQPAATPEPQATVTTPGGVQRPVPTLPRTPDFVQPTPPLPVGEVPQELLDEMIDKLAAQLSIDRQDIMVVAAEAVVWNDGSLGCPKPGEFYTEALVPGYRVILEVDGLRYDYHASENGYFFLCQSPQSGRGLPPDSRTPDR
ncbi:MAG: hypothetical protein JXB30_16620 [Anaerolineae bacterium]|nr:hypothetical protein [Anaerolineae bacterium]